MIPCRIVTLGICLTFACRISLAGDEKGSWISVSDATIKKIEADGKKIGYPAGGGISGVTVDRTSGDVFMVVQDNGLWRSKDKGATFERIDGGKIGGRAETGFALDADPEGKRIMCNIIYGSSAMILDSGASVVKSGTSHLDYGATDWSDGKTMIANRHESGGKVCVSSDGSASWKDIGAGYACVGIFDSKTFVATKDKEAGILRSTDGGATWSKVSDLVPAGRVMKVFKGIGYWTSKGGLLVSKDKGATWAVQGKPIEAGAGPYFGKDEKHLIVAAKQGLMETTDGGTEWKLAAPFPEKIKYESRGWFGNFAWDPQNDILYASSMGQPLLKYQR